MAHGDNFPDQKLIGPSEPAIYRRILKLPPPSTSLPPSDEKPPPAEEVRCYRRFAERLPPKYYRRFALLYRRNTNYVLHYRRNNADV